MNKRLIIYVEFNSEATYENVMDASVKLLKDANGKEHDFRVLNVEQIAVKMKMDPDKDIADDTEVWG